MEILEGEALYRRLIDAYSRDPRGWSFTICPSRGDSFFDAQVTGTDESWRLKIDSIFKPSPLALGVKSEPTARAGSPLPLSFGFRKFDSKEAPSLLSGSEDGMSRLLSFLGSVTPVVPTMPGSYLQGPYVYSNRPLPTARVSGEQERVDDRLSQELRRLLRKRYPGYQ